jgi:hypothetical protein
LKIGKKGFLQKISFKELSSHKFAYTYPSSTSACCKLSIRKAVSDKSEP